MPVAANTLAPLPLNPMAVKLAYLGLVPFALGAALVWLLGGYSPEAYFHVTQAMSAFAAVTISFLGGIHWGLAFRQSAPQAQPFVWGVVPSLVAIVAVLMPPSSGFVLHGVMLVLCYLVDRRHYPALGAAAWLTLRFRLSSVAALCCFLAAAGS
ncbi:DUF3429 domain-containing protein [Roseateles oligotrophus]|uniref:DUF3429 domain-containing protein n=1 Tax=Roseateles oligotrophus TaxID=1769250 RepID=A0ABT2YDZ9_9BURK|nr:DUF3429 domain-containing protein [Roseateles oligotrophus]MCV2368280.1 DUF3429 domain-containing protein [Roseateles oligotrophus]